MSGENANGLSHEAAPPSHVAGVNVDQFGELFGDFLERVVHGRDRLAPWREILCAHFTGEPADLPVLIEPMSNAQRVNLQVALDAFLGEPSRTSKLYGVLSGNRIWEGGTRGT